MTQENDLNADVWSLSDLQRLRRFLCLGSDKAVLSDEEAALNKENGSCVKNLIQEGHGEEVVTEILKYIKDGRAIKQQPAIFSLALCAKLTSDTKIKQLAYQALPEVCRTATALFQFVEYTQNLSEKSGWGRARRSAISAWYNGKQLLELAYAVTKYRQRNGWSHLDLLRLAHVKPTNEGTAMVMKYITKGLEKTREDKANMPAEYNKVLEFLCDVETVKHSHDEQQVAALVEKQKLSWEHIPTWMRGSREVWRALLPHMPLTALLRQLGKLTRMGLLSVTEADNMAAHVIERLKNQEQLHEARIHPFQLLLAQKAYERGRGEKVKKVEWSPNPSIVEALNSAFCAAFGSLEATNQRYLLSLDVGCVNGCPVVPSTLAAAAMTMLLARTESQVQVMAFSDSPVELPIKSTMSLQEIEQAITKVKTTKSKSGQMVSWAGKNRRPVDVFVVFTDSVGLSDDSKPAVALRSYRQTMNLPQTRMIICSLVSNSVSLADPNDAGMLDMAGFDSSTPQVIHNFVTGNL